MTQVTMTFPNLVVSDVQRTTEFYQTLGFEQNKEFSNENATAIVINETTVMMFLKAEFFGSFLPQGSAVSADSTQVRSMIALLLPSDAEVDDFAARAQKAGAKFTKEPTREHGMYGGQLADPDGHLLEFLAMGAPA